MEALLQVLPIIIYFLLIILIVVGIVLGIKLIITIDKVEKIMDDVKDKIETVSPVFNVVGLVSDKLNTVVSSAVSGVENLIYKLFFKKKNKDEMESEIDE